METQLKNLKKYYKNTDYKLINRVICSVCGRYRMVKNLAKLENDPQILIENKAILSRFNLTDCSLVKPFLYNNTDLYDLVLDKDGINVNTNKVSNW